jgi:hypothetical protein
MAPENSLMSTHTSIPVDSCNIPSELPSLPFHVYASSLHHACHIMSPFGFIKLHLVLLLYMLWVCSSSFSLLFHLTTCDVTRKAQAKTFSLYLIYISNRSCQNSPFSLLALNLPLLSIFAMLII